MNKTQTWKYLADMKVAEFNELDTERRGLNNAKKSIEDKINYVAQIIEEEESEVNNKDAVFRLDEMHKTRQIYISQLRKMQQGLVTQTIDAELKLSRVLQQMQLLQMEKQRYEKLAELSNKKIEKFETLLEQKDSDQFALQYFLQKRRIV